jgi:hypothetical protein
MEYIGYNPEESFQYVEPMNGERNSKGELRYKMKLLKRLELKKERIPFKTYFLDYLSVSAKFFSNIDYLDLGFAVRCYSRTVDLDLHPYVKLVDKRGKEISPDAFFRKLLLIANYPIHLYNYSCKINTMGRLLSAYREMQVGSGKYKKWSFIQ